MSSVLVGVDIGTHGIRAEAYDEAGRLRASAEYPGSPAVSVDGR